MSRASPSDGVSPGFSSPSSCLSREGDRRPKRQGLCLVRPACCVPQPTSSLPSPDACAPRPTAAHSRVCFSRSPPVPVSPRQISSDSFSAVPAPGLPGYLPKTSRRSWFPASQRRPRQAAHPPRFAAPPGGTPFTVSWYDWWMLRSCDGESVTVSAEASYTAELTGIATPCDVRIW